MDLSKKSGLEHAVCAIREHPGADLWASLPCTTVTALQNATVARLGSSYVSLLQKRRRLLVCMFHNFEVMASVVLSLGGTVSFEWPRNCHGWKIEELSKYFKDARFKRAALEGCTVGMRSASGCPLLKGWAVQTTSSELHGALHQLRCTGDHVHDS